MCRGNHSYHLNLNRRLTDLEESTSILWKFERKNRISSWLILTSSQSNWIHSWEKIFFLQIARLRTISIDDFAAASTQRFIIWGGKRKKEKVTSISRVSALNLSKTKNQHCHRSEWNKRRKWEKQMLCIIFQSTWIALLFSPANGNISEWRTNHHRIIELLSRSSLTLLSRRRMSSCRVLERPVPFDRDEMKNLPSIYHRNRWRHGESGLKLNSSNWSALHDIRMICEPSHFKRLSLPWRSEKRCDMKNHSIGDGNNAPFLSPSLWRLKQ